ncbi:hypothetical protein JCM5350_000174 [Sporobolomyces pararoseus]
MSLQLPPELLRLVVDNFRLPPFSSPRRTLELEKETRSTLYSLCLTSRTFSHLAQPLLFDFVRIRNFETLYRLVGINAENGRLLVTRWILYEGTPVDEQEEGEEEESLRLFRKLSTCADRIEELIIYDRLHPVPSTFSLKRLFLSKLELGAVPTMPCLEVLGLYNVYIEPESTTAPSVRHLTFDNSEWEVSEEDATLLTCLAPQLDSIVLLSDNYSSVHSEAPALSSPAILALDPVAASGSPHSLQVSFSTLDSKPSTFLRPILFPSSIAQSLSSVISSLHQLSLECQERNIEVIYEEQSDQIKGECQISEEFMSRMTKKRIEREAKVSEEE